MKETKNIHSFWIQGELSPINLLTIRSFKEMGHNFIIHTYNDKLTTECELRDASEVMKKEKGQYYTGLHPNMSLGLFGDNIKVIKSAIILLPAAKSCVLRA